VKRRYRLGLTAIALASSIAVGGLLIWLGSRSEGPLTASLERIGTMMGSIEHGIQQRVAGGTGRSADLAWFSPYRNAPAKLRKPEPLLLGAYDSGLRTGAKHWDNPASDSDLCRVGRQAGAAIPTSAVHRHLGLGFRACDHMGTLAHGLRKCSAPCIALA
jgi:hypothetical protein